MSKNLFKYCLLFSAIAPGLYAKDSNVIYTVKKNDTLNKIAKKNNITIEDILELNNIKNPNIIFPGMKLKISNSSKNTTRTILNDSQTYTVKENDTLNKIAKKFKISVKDIIQSNNISNPSLIYPGEILNINSSSINEKKTFKIEVSPESYIEVYYKGEILGYKNIKGKETFNITGDKIKTGENLQVKVYDKNGTIKEKKVTISEKSTTFITFIDKNNNRQLDINDELITEGSFKINNMTIPIDSTGETSIPGLIEEKTYDLFLTAENKNIINKKFSLTLNNEKVYIPVRNYLYNIKGNIFIDGKVTGDIKSFYNNLLIRLKNIAGDEVALFLVDENGEFSIDELPQGYYYYDVEYVSPDLIKTLVTNKEIHINNKKIHISLEFKKKINK